MRHALLLSIGLLLALAPWPVAATAPETTAPTALSYGRYRDWTTRLEIEIGRSRLATLQQRGSTWATIDDVRVLVPFVDDGATHDAHRKDARLTLHAMTGTRRVLADDEAEPRGGGAALLERRMHDIDGLILEIEQQTTTYDTTIDETEALRYGWPAEGALPEALGWTLQPEPFVESDAEVVQRLVATWTNERAQKVAPYTLAKFLAGRVLEHVDPNRPLNDVRTPRGVVWRDQSWVDERTASGVPLRGAAFAALTGYGSEHDMACLLAACYRAAGLPARLVIAQDPERERTERGTVQIAGVGYTWRAVYEVTPGGGVRLVELTSGPGVSVHERPWTVYDAGVRSWVEFFLYSEAHEQGEWIPVDIVELRKQSSRAYPLDRAWKHFGTCEGLRNTAVFANHWLPPSTAAEDGTTPAASATLLSAPAFWTWAPGSDAPPIRQGLRVTSFNTAARGDEAPRERRPGSHP